MSAAVLQPARLVSTNLQRARGQWVRLCPQWWMTGHAANWTTLEPKLRAERSQAKGAQP